MAKYGSDLREDRRRGRPQFDDDREEPFPYTGAPQPIGRTQPRQFGVCNPPQTLDAIIKPKGKGGRGGSSSFSGESTERKRQTGPKLSGRARRAERKKDNGKKGGKR